MVLFDPLPFSNILFISVLNTLSDATNYKFTTLQADNHTSPSPQLFQVFLSFCLLKSAFSLIVLSTMIRNLFVSRPVLIFFKQLEYLLVSLKVELRRIPFMTYKKSISLTSVFPPLIRPVDLPIHLKRLLTVIIEKKTSL